MLQKILTVLVGLIMSVVGALSPDGLLAGRNEGGADDELAGNVAEETLATLRTSDGQAFARISILWVEVDGHRVTEDAWGTGEVEEMRFKVGVKGVDDAALAVGGKVIELHPTDIITVRMFRGDFSYRGLGTPLATLQLQGTVKTTVLKEGDLDNRVLTKIDGIVQDAAPSAGGEEKVAYVVLTTGKRVDTVAVEDGGSRIFTEEAATATAATNEPGNLLAKWVKIDDRLIQEYTWGDGTLGKVEFEPAEAASRSVVLAFNGETFEVPAGERVVVEDFVGEYLIYQVSGGLIRVRLDGYARSYSTAAALPVPQQGGVGAPLTSFEFAPVSPRTIDTVQFRDRSTDDGVIVFRHWDFGDNSSAVLPEPTHRYERPGTYQVTLSVTDNDLKTSNMTRTIIVRNTEPVPDFDFSPHIVTTDTLVAFSDHSYDPDGTLSSWSWDFGDGTTSNVRHPTHRYTRGGNVTVTLTVTDDLGGRESLSKVILVRNTPPLAGFTYSPGSPLTLDPVQFISNSSDSDGAIVNWNWSFGDGRYGMGSSPVHSYQRPGLYTVSLTVTDDGGDSDTASTTLLVGNRPPFADFIWTPEGQAASIPLLFTSQASDPDGLIVSWRWSWGDGSVDTSGQQASHTFPAAGTYQVTLTVMDNTLGVSNVTRTVTVANSAPRANMIVAPNPTYRGVPVTFSDASTDPDGDLLQNFTWDLGDGAVAFSRIVTHTYAAIGSYPITLIVTDDEGQSSGVTRTLRVLNRPPLVTADFTPKKPSAGDMMTFTATGLDPDLAGGDVNFTWVFSDGPTLYGPTVNRSFARAGNYSATVRGLDTEGGLSAPQVLAFQVSPAKPVVNFTWSPLVPVPNQQINFTDHTTSANGAIREWRWNFMDGQHDSISVRKDPTHAYRQNGSYLVRLEVRDIANQTAFAEKLVFVNLPPVAKILAPGGILPLGSPIEFDEASTDADGTVVNWTWAFGDGTTSYARVPTHPGYLSPGAYTVRLTVTDDRGATNFTTLTMNVANTPPVAAWEHSPQNPVRGQLVSFMGYDHSYDPDGTGLTNFEWTFGDGTPATGGANAGNVTHSFLRSGRFTVGLKVFDGAGSSLRTPLSHKPLNITPDHSVKLNVKGLMPDGSEAPITLPPYSVTVTVGGVAVDGGSFFPNGNLMEVNVDPSLWVHGDLARVRVFAPFLSGINEQQVVLQDGVYVINITFALRMAVKADVVPAPGQNVMIPILPASSDHNGDPLYASMLEKPHGTGTITYADGSRAPFQRIHIEARWVPLRALGDYRNVTENSETAGVFPNFCKAGDAQSDAYGEFNWTFDGQSPCYLNAVANGVYPVGRWEVRARPQVPTAENRVGMTKVFYVDPTGGILLGATLGLA